jgi:aminopeptidase YwaD
MKASGSVPTNNDYLWVDNLAFSGVVTGIENQESLLSNVSVFPNPSAELINVNLNLKSEQKVSLELIDMLGKVITVKDLGTLQGDSKQSINVSGITKGTYVVRVVTEKGTEVRKIIIE